MWSKSLQRGLRGLVLCGRGEGAPARVICSCLFKFPSAGPVSVRPSKSYIYKDLDGRTDTLWGHLGPWWTAVVVLYPFYGVMMQISFLHPLGQEQTQAVHSMVMSMWT